MIWRGGGDFFTKKNSEKAKHPQRCPTLDGNVGKVLKKIMHTGDTESFKRCRKYQHCNEEREKNSIGGSKKKYKLKILFDVYFLVVPAFVLWGDSKTVLLQSKIHF